MKPVQEHDEFWTAEKCSRKNCNPSLHALHFANLENGNSMLIRRLSGASSGDGAVLANLHRLEKALVS